MGTTYVFGHKNPDTDAICAAISYAYLKNRQAPGHVPARLGELNNETRFVLKHFGVDSPLYLPHIYIRAQDIMSSNVISALATATVYEVGDLLRSNEIHAVPIVEGDRALGIVNERALAQGYLRELRVQSLENVTTQLGKVATTLGARIIVGDPDTTVNGHVLIGAMSPDTMVGYISPGDLVILGNRENAQEAALEAGVSCLVLTGNIDPSETIQQMARERDATILVTPHDTFATARIINLSVPARTLLEEDVLTVGPESIIEEITPDLLASKNDMALVNDMSGRLVGVLTKSDILARRRHRVILVDHSERSQSADGIDRAEIVEIVDHHRLGGIESAQPILALIAPVGCTSTLVFRRYRELDIKPPRAMAGLMVAAILSDTMLLKSPTTTEEDIAAVERLGEILGEDPLAFGREMYNAKFDIAQFSADELLTTDMKPFNFGTAHVAVAQIEVGDKEKVLERKEEILEAMRRHQAAQDFDLMILMVTDILREGTELLVVGRTRLVERAFDVELVNHAVYLPGVLSRKQQVIPPLSAVF